MSCAVIGVDLGGTNLRASLISSEGEILDKHKEATDAGLGRQKVLAKVIENIRRQQKNAELRGVRVAAVGVGAPGVVHARLGVVVKSPNFPDWNNFPLQHELETAIGAPVFLENDANAAALGEQWQGAARGVGSMIFITLGTGVGGGIVHEGKILHGADGMAGEVGHMTIIPDGRTCGCGNRGCLEMYASSRGIVMSYREKIGSVTTGELTSASIFQAAREGDAVAAGVMAEMGRFLGIGIASLINIFNPEMVVIGGGVKDAWPLFIDATLHEIRERAFEYLAERTKIVPSILGDDAGVVGAAAAALQRMKN